MYSYKTDPLTGTILPVFEDKHNHVLDSCRYLLEGIRHMKKKKRSPMLMPFSTSVGGMGYWLPTLIKLNMEKLHDDYTISDEHMLEFDRIEALEDFEFPDDYDLD